MPPINQQTPGLPAVIRAALDARLLEVHTHLVGHIEDYDAKTQRATVQLELRQPYYAEDGSRVPAQIPPLVNVPVLALGGGGGRLTFPVQRGDQCWVEFSEASLDLWDARGGDVDPVHDRRFHLSDAVCWVAITDKAHAKPARTDCVALEGDDVRAGDPASAAFLALKSDVENLRNWCYAQFKTTGGHTHTVSGAATVGTTTVAYGPPPPIDPLQPTVPPPAPDGTQNLKGS